MFPPMILRANPVNYGKQIPGKLHENVLSIEESYSAFSSSAGDEDRKMRADFSELACEVVCEVDGLTRTLGAAEYFPEPASAAY